MLVLYAYVGNIARFLNVTCLTPFVNKPACLDSSQTFHRLGKQITCKVLRFPVNIECIIWKGCP